VTNAAIFESIGKPLRLVDDLVVDDPREGEIAIEMLASGVCHSDLSAQNGTMLMPPNTILGHEGIARITALGPNANEHARLPLAVGDHVVVSWVPQCGRCYFCMHHQPHLCEKASVTMSSASMLDGTRRAHSAGSDLGQMAATGTFATNAVIPAIAAIPIDADIDPVFGSLIGCGVLTGVGAALNTATISEGDTVAVVGCGGVGLNVIQGAVLAGAGEIIAIDLNDQKLELASTLGATITINGATSNVISQVMKQTGQRGADVVFEVIGLGPTIEQAVQLTRRGGQTILVGIPAMSVMLQLPAFFGVVLQEKTIKGCWYGSSDVTRDVPRIVEQYRAGQIHLAELVSDRIELAQVNDALASLASGTVTRSVIVY
jgi:Zn-dependent alcohol dehydrogenase